MQLGMLETVGLGWEKVDEYVDKINQISAEQVREVARKYLLEDKLTIAYLHPQAISKQKQKRTVSGGRHAN
jgi:zinc protease